MNHSELGLFQSVDTLIMSIFFVNHTSSHFLNYTQIETREKFCEIYFYLCLNDIKFQLTIFLQINRQNMECVSTKLLIQYFQKIELSKVNM